MLARFNPIHRAENIHQNGIVLIGDADQSFCRAASSGVGWIPSDVATLARLVTGWLATSGMGADKIETFYAEAAKYRVDATAIHDARRRREPCFNTGWGWHERRALYLHARQARRWLYDAIGGLRPTAQGGVSVDPATILPGVDHLSPMP